MGKVTTAADQFEPDTGSDQLSGLYESAEVGEIVKTEVSSVAVSRERDPGKIVVTRGARELDVVVTLNAERENRRMANLIANGWGIPTPTTDDMSRVLWVRDGQVNKSQSA